MNKDQIIKTLTQQARKQFPEIKGVKPQVKWAMNSETRATCTLIFQTTISINPDRSMYKRIKVTGNSDGKIIKITSSK